jgi:thiamine kinase-like enzyme
MKNYKLIGHSGCKLEIEKQDEYLLVIKTSKDSQYNERLERQCKKQINFKNNSLKAPIIFSNGNNNDGLFNFSMEYINGSTLADYFKDIKISSIAGIAEKFIKIIPQNYNFDQGAKEIFYLKIKELEEKIGVKEDETLKRAFKLLKDYDWKNCATSDCHGDLTLENIIYGDGNLYLIDFLDSFYDSWMIDLAKIFQDVECFWSYRSLEEIDENLEIRLLILKQIILDKLLSLRDGQVIIKTIYAMLLLNLLRIIPYTKDEKTKKYLMREISKIISKINTK